MATILEIETRADVAAASADLLDLGADARAMGADLTAAGDDARTFGTDLSGVADGSDALASKSSQATGALGALAGGLEAVGLERYAAGLEAAAIGTDVMSGAGDALNLIAETSAGKWLVNTARTVAHTVATGAQTVATGAMTAAQGALNIVMAANPILLVVIAVTALVAGLILAYRHSETFRNIVDGAFTKAKEVVAAAAEQVSDFIEWMKDLPGKARDAWEAVTKAVGNAIDDAVGFVQDLIDKLDSFGLLGDVIAGYFEVMFFPIKTAIGWVQDLIDKIKSIDFPDIDIPFLPRNAIAAGGKPTAGTGDAGAGGSNVVAVNLTVAPQDKDKAVADLVDSMREYFARRGQTLTLTEAPA